MTDPWIVRVVVCILGAIAILGLLSVTYLISVHTDAALLAIPGSIATTALGALGAVLVSTRSGPSDPPPGG